LQSRAQPGTTLAVSDPTAERSALLEQVAGYLAWEEELGGQAIPCTKLPAAAPSAREAGDSAASSARGGGVQAGRPDAAAQQVEAEPGARETGVYPARPAPEIGVQGRAARPAPPESGAEHAAPRSTLAALAAAPRAPTPEAAVDLHRRLALIEEQVHGCTRCELHKARTQTVFARGNPASRLVFVGEGPGQEEDRTGLPFVGPAGQLLDKMVAAMGFKRDDVYICNIVKCRPPGNRTPLPSEAGACGEYLLGQLDAIQPAVIVALGRCAAENMGLVASGGWRGRWGKFREVDVMPTYHPAFLLRSPEFKRPVWEDLQKVMARLQLAK
jgi:uracil-DNA glycosylase family 4